MLYRWLAQGVLLVHLAFLVFVGAGALLAWRWRRLLWAHVPAVVWSLLSITIGLACPLTGLEKHFRRLAGAKGYPGGFVDHYVEGVIYPERFTPVLRGLVVAAVILGYAGVVARARRRESGTLAYSGPSPAA